MIVIEHAENIESLELLIENGSEISHSENICERDVCAAIRMPAFIYIFNKKKQIIYGNGRAAVLDKNGFVISAFHNFKEFVEDGNDFCCIICEPTSGLVGTTRPLAYDVGSDIFLGKIDNVPKSFNIKPFKIAKGELNNGNYVVCVVEECADFFESVIKAYCKGGRLNNNAKHKLFQTYGKWTGPATTLNQSGSFLLFNSWLNWKGNSGKPIHCPNGDLVGILTSRFKDSPMVIATGPNEIRKFIENYIRERREY